MKTAARLARKSERGVVAILMTLLVLALIALILLAVQVGDVGMVRGLLQGSADEAALAGALQLNRKQDGLLDARVQAEAMVTGGRNFPQAVNEGRDLDIKGTAFDTGVWSFANSTFTPSINPGHVNAVRVIGRKVSGQNSPVPMFLGGLFGSPDTVPVARQSIAAVGGAAELPCKPNFPIAVCDFSMECGKEMVLFQSPTTSNNSAWTSFDDNSASANDFKTMINNCSSIPSHMGGDAQVLPGDPINLNNGQVDSAMGEAKKKFDDWQADHPCPNVRVPDPDNPTCDDDTCAPSTTGTPISIKSPDSVGIEDCGMGVSLPVIHCTSGAPINGTSPVKNFVLFVITQVVSSPPEDCPDGSAGKCKFIKGVPVCGAQIPGSTSIPTECSEDLPIACATIPILVNKNL